MIMSPKATTLMVGPGQLGGHSWDLARFLVLLLRTLASISE